MMYKQKGMTLLELMIVVAIILIVVTIGVPSVAELQRTMRIKGAVESSYFTIISARSGAISRGTDTTVNFDVNAPWCIGVSDFGTCQCNTANSCTVNGVETVIQQDDFEGVVLSNVSFNGNNFTTFDGLRGLATNGAGSFQLDSNGIETRLTINRLGRVNICTISGQLGNYQQC